jgi:hypothetical protein
MFIYARTIVSFCRSRREKYFVCVSACEKNGKKKYSSTQANFLPPKKTL